MFVASIFTMFKSFPNEGRFVSDVLIMSIPHLYESEIMDMKTDCDTMTVFFKGENRIRPICPQKSENPYYWVRDFLVGIVSNFRFDLKV